MILGLSSFAYGWAIGDPQGSMHPRNVFDLIQLTREAELSCLQIGDNLPLHELTTTALHELKSVSKQYGIRLEVGARQLTESNLYKYIDICSSIESTLLRFVIDGSEYEPTVNEVVSLITKALPTIEQAGVTLGIENHDRFKAKDLVYIMDSVGSNSVGICLDCVNSMGAGEGLEYVADILAPYTVNLHIKDFTIERLPHKMGFTVVGTQVGLGMTNLPMLMEKLSPYNRCKSAVLEQWVPWQSDLDATIQTEKKWATQGIQHLKGLQHFKN